MYQIQTRDASRGSTQGLMAEDASEVSQILPDKPKDMKGQTFAR